MRLGVAAALVGGSLVPGDVEVADGAIAAVGLEPRGSGIAAPGFVDLQVNGFAGVDLMHAGAAARASAGAAMLATGVTAYRPTVITAAEDELVAALGAIGGPHAPGGRGCSARTSRARSCTRTGSARTPPSTAATRTPRCSSGSSPPGPSRTSPSRRSSPARPR